MHFTIRAVAASLLPFLAGCSVLSFGGSETGFGGIEGTVVDHEGTGIRGAVIDVVAPGESAAIVTGTTDYFGYFKIEHIAARRNLTVRIVKQFRTISVERDKKGVRVGGGHVTDLGDIELKPVID